MSDTPDTPSADAPAGEVHTVDHERTPPWPRWTEYLDVEALVPNPDNPKGHANKVIDESLDRFGYVEQVTIDERTGMLVAGHGRRERVLAAKTNGEEPPEGIVVTDDGVWLIPVGRGWSSANDDEALAYVVASNRTSEIGGWEKSLSAALAQVSTTSRSFEGIGYTADEFAALLPEQREPSSGELLARADVTIGDPVHKVNPLDQYRVGRHRLICADLMTEHHAWRRFLKDGVLFCPYPGPFIALGSAIPDDVTLLLVQPDPYIAGHVLDKWAAVYGDSEIEQLAAPVPA